MAKVYDPILCMMVDKPDKAQDAMNKAIETADAEGEKWITMRGSHVKIDGEGNAVAGNERVKNIINSGKAGASKESSASENNKQNANTSKADAEKTKKVDSVMKKYGERHSYSPTLRDMLSLSVDIGKKYDEDGIIDDDDIKQYKQKYDKLLDMHMDYDISKTTMNKINTDLVKVLKDYGFDKYQLKSLGWAYTGRDSMPALDKAIKTADGMFASAFGEYSKGAKFKKDKFLKELAGISDAKEFAKRMQTLDNELRKSLERLDEAYNVAGKDYYAARNEIRSIMDAFSSEAFGLYRKLDTK